MLVKNFRIKFAEQLSTIYPKTEIDTFFFLLVEEYLGFQRVDIVLKADTEISEDKIALLENALERLQQEEPIQYILGKTEFYGLPFKVTNDTLIPRPETEELVEWILSEIKDQRQKTKDVISSSNEKSLHILDIGTGTGCIPVSLAKHLPNASISAIDVSNEALLVAKENAQSNNVLVNFFEQDILQAETLNVIANKVKQSQNNNEITSSQVPRNDIEFDIIVSNPPYVRELEKAEIKNNVLENEPHLALFVKDENPLLFYHKIADLAKQHLTKNGVLFFEINQYLGKETVDLLKAKGFTNVELRKDLFRNDRMIKACL